MISRPPQSTLFPYTTLFRSKVGTILTIAGLFRIGLMLPAGSIMDHVGRKPVVVGAAFISIPGSLAYIFADGWVLLLRSEEHTSELQSRRDLVCRLLLEKKKK